MTMVSNDDDRPLADPGREQHAMQLRAEGLSPELWAARYAHTVACSSLDEFRYRDPELDAWIRRMHEVLRSPSLLEECRARLLSEDERQRIAAEADEPF